MNMNGACWMRRSLGEPVSALYIDSQNNVIAGGWNGRLIKWSASGDELWSVQLPDRIGSISINSNGIYATAGLHICAVQLANGSVIWQQALEGSADTVLATEELIYATSSVYDIEHNDFIESAIWCFDKLGNEVWKRYMAERPWTLNQYQGDLYLGLGRPKMGLACVTKDGKLSQIALASEAPVTAAAIATNGVLFGHANGDLTNSEGKLYAGKGESINTLSLISDRTIIIVYDQEIIRLDADYNEVAKVLLGSITAISFGFKIGETGSVWAGIQEGKTGLLKVVSLTDGSDIASMQCGKINALVSNNNRIVVGDELGEIYVWEEAMFNRRINSTQVDEAVDEHYQTMRDRLNALRKR